MGVWEGGEVGGGGPRASDVDRAGLGGGGGGIRGQAAVSVHL